MQIFNVNISMQKKLCEKVSMLANGCRDSGQFCSVMDCSQSSTKIVCAKSCG